MTGELEPSGDGGELVPPGELRASYADRDRVAEQLRIAAGDGRAARSGSGCCAGPAPVPPTS